MKTVLLLLAFACYSVSVSAQNLPAYSIFTGTGKPSDFGKLSKAADASEVILFGELHDDPIAHWLQRELAGHLFTKHDTDFAIGAEMLELHQQKALEAYLKTGNIKLLTDSTKMWSNFGTDYQPLLEWCQQNKVPYAATNVTRKYASLIFKKGIRSLDTISTEERKLMCPLPFPFDSTLSQYKELIAMGKEMHASGTDFALAQAIKDATMAYSITELLKTKNAVLHLNGAYHSDFHQGIATYIEHYRKGTKVLTISTITQDQIKTLDKENRDKADFIIVVPNTMTRTMD